MTPPVPPVPDDSSQIEGKHYRALFGCIAFVMNLGLIVFEVVTKHTFSNYDVVLFVTIFVTAMMLWNWENFKEFLIMIASKIPVIGSK